MKILLVSILIAMIASSAMADTCTDRAVRNTRPIGCTNAAYFNRWVATAALQRRQCENKSKGSICLSSNGPAGASNTYMPGNCERNPKGATEVMITSVTSQPAGGPSFALKAARASFAREMIEMILNSWTRAGIALSVLWGAFVAFLICYRPSNIDNLTKAAVIPIVFLWLFGYAVRWIVAGFWRH